MTDEMLPIEHYLPATVADVHAALRQLATMVVARGVLPGITVRYGDWLCWKAAPNWSPWTVVA